MMEQFRSAFRSGFRYVVLWLGLVVVLGAINGGTDDTLIVRFLQHTIQADFSDVIHYTHDRITLHKEHFSETSAERVLLFRYNWKGQLLEWNSNRYVPSEKEVQHLLRHEQNEVLTTSNAFFYVIKRRTAQHVFLGLIPLKVAYPLQNQYLQDYLFAGRWNRWLPADDLNNSLKLIPINQPLESGITIRDAKGKPVFGLALSEQHLFRKGIRQIWIAVWVMGFALLWWQYGRKIKNTSRPLLWFGVWWLTGLGFRLGLYALPSDFFAGGIFSPHYLAVNEYLASLSDLTLMNGLILGLVMRGIPLLPQPEKAVLTESESAIKVGWYVCFTVVVLGAVAGLTGFWYLFDLLISHSKIYYPITDLSRVDGYTMIFYGNVLALLVSGTSVLNWWARKWWTYQRLLKIKLHYIALMVAGIFVLCLLIYPTERLAYVITGLLFVNVLLVAPSLRTEERSFVPMVLFLVSWAFITNAGIAYTYYQNLEVNMKQVATRLTPQRDFVTEYALERFTAEVMRDSAIWYPDPIYDKPISVRSELIAPLTQKYLYTTFRSYDHEITVINEQGRRLDDQYEIQLGRDHVSDAMMSPTNSPYFKRMVHGGSMAGMAYVGDLPITTSKGKKITIHIEISPRTVVEGKLYPQLLLDNRNKQRQTQLQGMDVAYYFQREFIRKTDYRRMISEDIPFPLALTAYESQTGKNLFRKSNHYYEYLRTENNGLTIFVRAAQRSAGDHFTAVSLLFYFFSFCVVVYYIRNIIRYFDDKNWDYFRSSLVFRIRFYLALLTIFPLLIVGGLTSGFFSSFFATETRNNLRQNLELVRKQVQDQLSLMDEMQQPAEQDTVKEASNSSREILMSIGHLLSTDINLYMVDGRLFSTTKPNIYHDVLIAPYILPQVLRFYEKGNKAELIVTERIGTLAYESGYLPITKSFGKEVIGYLNLPFVSQQDVLHQQTERILAYLLNIYLILFLVVLAVSILLTRSLTRPIQLLKAKLEDIRLDQPMPIEPEPIELKMRNEIGVLFTAYNRMLSRLFESRNRLALEEREKAYKAMAQQLAHEIKNPLTPMQLHMQMIQRNVKEGYDLTDEYLLSMSDAILTQIDKLNHIASTFSRLDSIPAPRISVINAGDFLWDIYELYRDADEAEVVLHLPNDSVLMLADVHQLNQVLVNIVKNALEAMERRGKVAISLSEDGINAIIKIADNGKGIPSDIRDNLYEFRFTTKKTGSGVGLYLSRKMMLNMKGTIRFESQTGTGTAFYLTLPLAVPTIPREEG